MTTKFIRKKEEAIEVMEKILEQTKSDEWIMMDFAVDLENDVSLLTGKEIEKVYRFGIALKRIPK